MKVEQKEKAPKTLIEFSQGIDEVLASMDKIEKTLKLSQSEFEASQSKKKSKNNKENKPSAKDEELVKQWKTIDEMVEKIHKDWNSYEVESMKKGGNAEKAKDLKKNLNLMTTAVENRKVPEILDNGSKVMFSLASFFDLYKDEVNGDLSRIKYAVYQAYLNGKSGNMENANRLLDSTEEYITRLRQKMNKDKSKLKILDKLSLAIMDMKQSLSEDSMRLLGIKKDIILKNIKSLEK